jgi:hypothetical protein
MKKESRGIFDVLEGNIFSWHLDGLGKGLCLGDDISWYWWLCLKSEVLNNTLISRDK